MRRAPSHPGEVFLSEWLEPKGYGAQAAAARAMQMSTNRLNEICATKRSVTPETAVLMGALTGTDPRVWLHMQADFDLWHALRDTRMVRLAHHAAKREAAASPVGATGVPSSQASRVRGSLSVEER
jgi:addiction module HigA family antidote